MISSIVPIPPGKNISASEREQRQIEKFEEFKKEQRRLMTPKLKESIKKRDNYTCCRCGASLEKEPHLLLHVDHIIPIARGGKTEPDNLQTLCWQCNLSKSDRLEKKSGSSTLQKPTQVIEQPDRDYAYAFRKFLAERGKTI